jgi:hypothetical protein
METKTLNSVTAGDLSKIFEKLKDEGLIFRCSFSQISKHLLKEFLPVNPFSVDFETLTKSYLEHIEFDKEDVDELQHELIKKFNRAHKEKTLNASKNESEFHKYICERYFGLVKEPKHELLEAFIKSSGHLKKIDETLDEIKILMEEIHKKNDSIEIQEKKPILYYYQAHNEKAKLEILSFIKYDAEHYALTNCYDNSLLSGLMGRTSYNYDWNPDSYLPRYPNDLSNKFGDLPYPQFIELCENYASNKSDFDVFLSNYIEERSIIRSVAELVSEHHILDSRKEIFEETLKMYQSGAKIMFATAVPSIIEGIFHDLCLLVGENENDLLREGFQHKLDTLQKHLDFELYYEYYSFRFRLFRNKVSHGRLTKADVNELADLLLLDLYQVCTLVKSDKLNINHKRFVINELTNNLPNPDYKYLMQYLLLDKIDIPSFYKLEKAIEEIDKLISSDGFWQFLETEIDKGGESVKHGIHIVLQNLGKREPSDPRCAMIFKKLRINKANKEIANQYLKYLTRDF